MIPAQSRLAIVVALAGGLAWGQAASPPEKLFINCDGPELLRLIPDLAGMNFDASQDGLDALLKSTGENLGAMLSKLVDLSAAEQIHEIRIEAGMGEAGRRENFRYSIKLTEGQQEQFNELRLDPAGISAARPPDGEFLAIGHFYKLVRYLLPQYRAESSFRYLGRSTTGGRDLLIVVFAQHPDSSGLRSHIGLREGRAALLQGVAWIEAATHRVVRLRADLQGRIEGFPFERLSTDISFVPVTFVRVPPGRPGTVLWLPAAVTVHARYAGGELHSVHRYSDYRFDAPGENAAGVPSVPAPADDDAWELVDRGISLARENKPSEAIAPLREALRLNPGMAAAHYYLAAALRDTNNAAGAEAELREALKQAPDYPIVHNALGVLLLNRGDMPAAVAELRSASQLQPKDAIVHYNLAQALEKTGDQKAALEEYRTASALAPDNVNFKARYQQLERPESGTTINVEVRQVLVPVVVTDKAGHYATGLTQADFRLFEDGIEQKISSFSVENAGVPSAAPVPEAFSQPSGESPAAAAPPSAAPVRRTYLICIDVLHSDFANFVSIRESLLKLFRAEPAGDAQYVVISMGSAMKVVQDVTSDPAVVLHVLDSPDFQKWFSGSRRNSVQGDLRAFRRELDEVRAACDAFQPGCESRKRGLPSQADRIASQDRIDNLTFLDQFRALIEQLRRGTGRRTIVLFSDGFQLVPGKQAYELLGTYFPELLGVSLRTVDRMPELEPVLHLAAAGNIPVYTIDSRGLYTSPYFDVSNGSPVPRLAGAVQSIMDRNASEAGDALSEIAAVSGGTFFHNSNDIFAGLQRAFADGRQYYMLAYVPSNSSSDGKFRAISVRVRDAKLVVNAKRGYWATSRSN
jgi:VWFA-related protein